MTRILPIILFAVLFLNNADGATSPSDDPEKVGSLVLIIIGLLSGGAIIGGFLLNAYKTFVAKKEPAVPQPMRIQGEPEFVTSKEFVEFKVNNDSRHREAKRGREKIYGEMSGMKEDISKLTAQNAAEARRMDEMRGDIKDIRSELGEYNKQTNHTLSQILSAVSRTDERTRDN